MALVHGYPLYNDKNHRKLLQLSTICSVWRSMQHLWPLTLHGKSFYKIHGKICKGWKSCFYLFNDIFWENFWDCWSWIYHSVPPCSCSWELIINLNYKGRRLNLIQTKSFCMKGASVSRTDHRAKSCTVMMKGTFITDILCGRNTRKKPRTLGSVFKWEMKGASPENCATETPRWLSLFIRAQKSLQSKAENEHGHHKLHDSKIDAQRLANLQYHLRPQKAKNA